jgi:hypothetical protein
MVDGNLWKRSISLYERCVRGTWRRAPLQRTLKVMCRKVLVTSIFP